MAVSTGTRLGRGETLAPVWVGGMGGAQRRPLHLRFAEVVSFVVVGSVDFGRWDPSPEERRDVEHQARRLPGGWRVECGGSPSALPLLVLVKDSAGEEFDRRSYEFGDFAAVARLVERVALLLEES